MQCGLMGDHDDHDNDYYDHSVYDGCSVRALPEMQFD
jgi:hypothetical protein